jgi:hypothetical protein
MNKRILSVMVLMAMFLVGCGGGVSSPPLIKLSVNGEMLDGLQGAYCWDRGIAGTVCADPIEPHFDQAVSLPINTPIQLQLDKPLPNDVTLSLSKEVFGNTIISETVPVSEMMKWSPAVEAGEYILTVHATWKQGDVSYRFSISFE